MVPGNAIDPVGSVVVSAKQGEFVLLRHRDAGGTHF